MHIAHSKRGGFFSVGQIEKLSGLRRRQIAILARQRRIPGARLSRNGYHYEYPDSEELRDWIKLKVLQVQRRKKPKQAKGNSGARGSLVTIQSICQWFELWQKRFAAGGNRFEKWPSAHLKELMLELAPIAHFHAKIKRILSSRR